MKRKTWFICFVIYEIILGAILWFSVTHMVPEREITMNAWEVLQSIVPLTIVLFMVAPGFSVLHDP
jgi:hypothetical protein